MTIWTISAQEGTGGDWVAAELTAAADVPRLDREMLARSAHELNPDELKVEDIEEVEERFGGRLSALSLSMAMMTASTAAAVLLEIELRHRLPDLGRAVFNEVARRPCVILSPGRLRRATEHPGPIHVRLCAPIAVRIATYHGIISSTAATPKGRSRMVTTRRAPWCDRSITSKSTTNVSTHSCST